VTRGRPELELRIACRPYLQQVVVAAIVQLEPGDRLAVTAIEALCEPQNRRQRPHDAARPPAQVPESVVLPLGGCPTMIPCHERDDVDFLRLEAAQIAVLDQIVRMFVVPFVTDVNADVVQDGCIFEPLTLAIGETVNGPRLIEQPHRQPGHLLRVLRPVVAALGQLDDAAPADVGIPVCLRDLFAVLGNVIEDEAFSEREIAQGDLRCAEPPQQLVHEDDSGDDQIGAARFESGDSHPLFEILRDNRLAQAPHLFGGDAPVAQRRVGGVALRGGDHAADAENGARCSDDAVETGASDLIEVFAGLLLDMPDQFSFVLRRKRIALDEPLRQPDDTKLETAAELDRRAGAARHLDTASADVDHNRDLAGCAHTVDGRRMDVARFLGPRDNPRPNAGLLGDGLEELAAVLGFTRGAGRNGDNFLDAMRFGQTLELREHLETCMHRLRRKSFPVKAAGPEPDHLLFPVDDLERQIRPDLHDDHVDGIGADVDSGDAHLLTFYIMNWLSAFSHMLIGRSELLRKHLDRFMPAFSRATKGDARALHQARVASRRLRELLAVLQLDRDATRKLSRRLRKVTRRLGAVRELDVLLILIDELNVARPEYSQALSRITVPVSKARDDVRKRVFDRMPAEEMRRIGRKLGRLVDNLGKAGQAHAGTAASDKWHWAVDTRTALRASRLTAAIVDAGAVYLPDRLHAVRIALKKLRYAVELAGEVTGRQLTAELRSLRRGQDMLGRLHDLQVLVDRVRQVQASLAPPSATVWRSLDRLVAALENDCRRLHARYMRQRPRLETIAARLSADPQAARGHGSHARSARGRSPRPAVHTLAGRSARRPIAV
jgi:CHAD domain-containing protein